MVYIRELYNYRRGIFDEFTSLIRATAPKYFGSGYGRAFWDANRHLYPDPIAKEIDEVLTDEERVAFYEQRDAVILEKLRQK